MSTIILDLDHTLLDTTAFKSALAQSLDVSVLEWDQAYDQFVRDNGIFRPHDFLHGVRPEQQAAFYKVLERLRHYFYPDSVAFFEKAHEAGYRLLIVTFGDEEWQQQKLSALHLPSYIETITTAEPKSNRLAEYMQNDTLVVDDNSRELEMLYQHWPAVHYYWMRRANGKYRQTVPNMPHHVITTLIEIKL